MRAASMNHPLDAIRLTIVDDDPTIPPVLANLLEQEFGANLNIKCFDDPRLAGQSLEDEGCDILLSDIEMPAMDGLALLKIARNTNTWTQIVFMTAQSTWSRLHE